MHRTHQRRQQRVAYAASVRLHTSGRPHPFEARSINLSRSGVLVESLQPCAIGTEVICDIPLPGGRRQLRGRVARMQRLSPAAVGLAIAFTQLDTPDQELLSEAVGQDDGRTRMVQVRFEGMAEPMRSRARLVDGGLRLSTALPFLRLRSPVEVTFLSGDSKVQSRGLIHQVELDQFANDGTPRLAVSVAFAAEPQVLPGAPVAVAPASEAPPTVPELPAMAATPVHVPDPKPAIPAAPPEPEGRGGAVGRVLLVAAAVALVGTGALTYVRSQAPVTSRPTAVPPPLVTVLPEPKPVEPTPAAPAPRTVQESQPVALPPPRPVLVVPPPLPPGTPGPSIESDGAETTAVVPVTGSTQGMIHRSLAHRRGVSVNLPLAQSELPMGLHTIDRDGLRYVWIRERAEGGIQIRFVFTNPPPDERLLELEDDAVKIRVRLHGEVAATKPADEETDPQPEVEVGEVSVSQQ
jgi:hypothetical protein